MTDTMKHSASDLQLQLARQIAENIISGGLQSGQHLRETELSATLNVSRSPVRAALGLLFSEGLVDKEANRGFFVRAAHDDFLAFLDRLPKTDDEIIKEAIARDWFEGAVPKEMSEGEIRKRYSLGRLTAQRILNSLSDEGIISRLPGYGWQFEPTLNSQDAHDESYDFRMIIEPSGMISQSFELDGPGAEFQEYRHRNILCAEPENWNSAELFRLDADFHLFLANCSQNRYVIQAMQQQNKLRRLLEYNSLLHAGRLRDSCMEHLEILESLVKGDRTRAANSMIIHLQKAKDAGPWGHDASLRQSQSTPIGPK